MTSTRFLLLISFTIVFGFACNQQKTGTVNNSGPSGSPRPAASADEFATTRAVFAKRCQECHGVDGSGGTKTVDGKKLRVPNLREGHALEHPDDDFVKQINKGGDGMPAFKDKLTPDEINDLVRFIRKEFQGK